MQVKFSWVATAASITKLHCAHRKSPTSSIITHLNFTFESELAAQIYIPYKNASLV